MKTKGWLFSILCVCVMMLCGCDTVFNNHFTDLNDYGNLKGFDDFPTFFPASVEDDEVNSYLYTTYSFMDDCYEVYLDMTVTTERLEQLLSEVKQAVPTAQEKAAYYADGYYEIVIADEYTVNADNNNAGTVWSADIQKVIYNPDTGTVIFEFFDAFDCGGYPLTDVAYFRRFGIDHTEYVQYHAQASYATITTHEDKTYSYEIKSYNGRVLARADQLNKQPKRQYVSDDVIGISLQMGTGLSTNTATYYDLQNGIVSETFRYVITAKHKYVVYAEYRDGEHIIILRDIFDKERRYEEYKPEDVSPVKADFVVGGYFNNKGNVNITYLSGENYTETNYTIVI